MFARERGRKLDADRHLAEYLHWLAVVAHGTPFSDIKNCADPSRFAAQGGPGPRKACHEDPAPVAGR